MSPQPPLEGSVHKKASARYKVRAAERAGGRDLEAQALLRAARLLQDLQDTWESGVPPRVEEVLKFNRQIWVVFYDNAQQSPPSPLHTTIVNLASFVFKRSVDILAAPESGKLSVLISINRDVAAGLMTRPVQNGGNEGQESSNPSST